MKKAGIFLHAFPGHFHRFVREKETCPDPGFPADISGYVIRKPGVAPGKNRDYPGLPISDPYRVVSGRVILNLFQDLIAPTGTKLILLLFFLIASCSEEPVETVFFNFKGGEGVFICNEGNFMYGNASLSFYDSNTRKVTNHIFQARNGAPLGDVVQSMNILGDRGFVVVNNSGKIYVIDTETAEFKGSITGLSSPRYIHFVSSEKAYITDLYNTKITIINPETLQKTGSIDVSEPLSQFLQHSTEQMVQWGKYVFVSCWSYDNTVLVIDSETDRVVEEIEVPIQPKSMALDKNSKLWVLTDGGFEGNPFGFEAPALVKIDASTFEVERLWRFAKGNHPSGLTMNATADTLYFLNLHVWQMPVDATKLPESPFIESPYTDTYGGFYSLSIDPKTSDVYVGDAIDHRQDGMVYRYSSSGELKDHFRVGIAPGYLVFK